MAGRVISKTIRLVGTWNEDVITDKVMSDVSHSAKTTKGTKMKLKASEKGISLSRAKFFQEKQTKVFLIKNIQTVQQISDYPRCIMLILSDLDKKYKIILFRCETMLDADNLNKALVDIKEKVESPNFELSKKDNGNWTLRGRIFHNANKHMVQIFNENQQTNGEAVVFKANGGVEIVPAPSPIEVHTFSNNHKDIEHDKVKVKDSKKKDSSSSSSSDDDFVIETEVTTQPYTPVVIRADHKRNEIQEITTRVEEISVKENPEIREVTRIRHTSAMDYPDSSRHQVYERPPKRYEETILPSKPVVYRATSSHSVAPQPVAYSRSSRKNFPMTAASPVYYTDPWGSRRVSRESSLLPTRVDPYNPNIMFDQQSMVSNTSRLSRSHRMRASELSIPTTVRRSVEHVYPRPVVVLRRGYEPITAYRTRPASYHARSNDLIVYHEDPSEAAMFP